MMGDDAMRHSIAERRKEVFDEKGPENRPFWQTLIKP